MKPGKVSMDNLMKAKSELRTKEIKSTATLLRVDGPFNQITEDEDKQSLEDAFQSKKEEQDHILISDLNINLAINISLPSSPKKSCDVSVLHQNREVPQNFVIGAQKEGEMTEDAENVESFSCTPC